MPPVADNTMGTNDALSTSPLYMLQCFFYVIVRSLEVRPRVITPSEGEGLPKGHLCRLDFESKWSNWLRSCSRRAAILFHTCSLFASLKERSDVVSSLLSYWQPRRASLHLERLWNSSAKVELVFDKNELFMRDLTDVNTLHLTWNFKASDAMNNQWVV